MDPALQKTALYKWHASRGGRLVDFAGWAMPVQYGSIVAEHQATRQAMTLFDVSHMGRLCFFGSDAGRFLDSLVTRRVSDLGDGQIRYGLMCQEQGGILDDVLVYRILGTDGRSFHMMVVNAGNREKILAWLRPYLDDQPAVLFEDRTTSSAMIAVQGPRAIATVSQLSDRSLSDLAYYHGRLGLVAGRPALISRTGYTGEDGCELIVAAEDAEHVWDACLTAGGPDVLPAGLGARDTLRLEAAMPLYGHELSEAIDPFQADLSFAVNLKDREFIGRSALVKLKQDIHRRKRIGLQMDGKRAAREHYPVLRQGLIIGEVTSGTLSPTLGYPVAMAYVDPDWARPGTELQIDLRGSLVPATVVPLPFYKRPS